ncbi:MAG: hypothetical protein KF847_19770 [Pirellulales bacterium]|nr:hypothetical protein [Pirellulales bacterium]
MPVSASLPTSAENRIYYRRTGQPAFPAMRPEDVEVTASEQTTGVVDGEWHAARSDDGLAESLGLSDGHSECVLIADALIVCRACLDSGLCSDRWRDGDWSEYDYAQLDAGHPEDYEQMCAALHLLSPSDALRQAWKIANTCPDTEHGRSVRRYMTDVARSFGEDPAKGE